MRYLAIIVALSGCSEPKPAPEPKGPNCIEVRGQATDQAEHDWSSACAASPVPWGYKPSAMHLQCIESACIAFRGMP